MTPPTPTPDPNSDPALVMTAGGRALGIGLFVSTVGLAFLMVLLGRTITWQMIVLAALPMVGAFWLWRPKWFERTVLVVADHLPWVKYQKPEPPK